MSNETYRQFDPWRPSPVKEISRRQIVETHYFNVDHVSYESNQIGSFERYFVPVSYTHLTLPTKA